MPRTRNSGQLPFDLSLPASVTRDDLAESPANALAVSLIDAWPDWPGQMAIICGPPGAGKSHIAAAWQEQSGALRLEPDALGTEVLSEMVQYPEKQNFLVEDIGPGAFDETALFHFFNHVRQSQGSCLMTATTAPGEWSIKLPDLKSRLRTVQVAWLSEPDDMLLKQVMFKLFADRQLQVDDKVIDYCIARMERSLQAAAILVSAIDEEALRSKSAVTKPLAGDVLRALNPV